MADVRRAGSHDLIGTTTTTLNELQQQQRREWDLLNPKKLPGYDVDADLITLVCFPCMLCTIACALCMLFSGGTCRHCDDGVPVHTEVHAPPLSVCPCVHPQYKHEPLVTTA